MACNYTKVSIKLTRSRHTLKELTLTKRLFIKLAREYEGVSFTFTEIGNEINCSEVVTRSLLFRAGKDVDFLIEYEKFKNTIK